MSGWLGRQRKQKLLELAQEAGYKTDADTLKDEIIQGLDQFLTANSSQLSSNSVFDSYYNARRTPFKPRPSVVPSTAPTDGDATAAPVKSVVKQGGKRPSKVKNESVDESAVSLPSPVRTVTDSANKVLVKIADNVSSATSTALAATESAVQRTPVADRRDSRLPASPRDVADQIEYQTEKLYAGIDEAFTSSGIPQTIDHFRELCSSVMGVQLTTLLIEAFALQRQIFPWRYVTDIPWIGILGMPERLPLKIPDFFVLLTGYFWSTTILWSATSIFIPLLFAYFYNLTTRDVKRHGSVVAVAKHVIDPFTFNTVKALTTYIVYSQGSVLGGIVDERVAARVDDAMFGGSTGMIIGSIVCAVASLYEAAQRK